MRDRGRFGIAVEQFDLGVPCPGDGNADRESLSWALSTTHVVAYLRTQTVRRPASEIFLQSPFA